MINRRTFLIGLTATSIAALGAWSLVPRTAQDLLSPVGAASAEEAAQAAEIKIEDMAIGSADAKVTLIEYASFTCPHCANFHATVFGDLKRDYIDTGKVRFVYREVYFDRYGLWAAMMARCGGEMRYFGISDILFDTQKEWAGSEDPTVVVGNLKKIGRSAGMDDATLDSCMQNGAMAQAMVTRYEESMKEYDVEGTPTLIINGEKHSNMSYADLKAILDAKLAE